MTVYSTYSSDPDGDEFDALFDETDAADDAGPDPEEHDAAAPPPPPPHGDREVPVHRRAHGHGHGEHERRPLRLLGMTWPDPWWARACLGCLLFIGVFFLLSAMCCLCTLAGNAWVSVDTNVVYAPTEHNWVLPEAETTAFFFPA